MGTMKKLSTSDPDIIIEWRCAPIGQASCSIARDVAREDLLNLARALGRLAAQRDLAQAASRRADECLSSARKQLQ